MMVMTGMQRVAQRVLDRSRPAPRRPLARRSARSPGRGRRACPPRTSRVTRAVEKSPSVSAGSTRCSRPPLPRARQELERDREDEDQHDAEPEHGHRLAEQRRRTWPGSPRGVAPDRARGSRRAGMRPRRGDGQGGEREPGPWRASRSRTRGRAGCLDTAASVPKSPVDRPLHEAPSTGRRRADRSPARRAKRARCPAARVGGEQEEHGVAAQSDHAEHDQGDADQDERGLGRPADD